MRGKIKRAEKAIKNIKALFESQEKVMELFDDYSRIVSETKKNKTKYGEGLNILTPK